MQKCTINFHNRVCLLVGGRESRVASRGSRVTGGESRVTSRGSKNPSQSKKLKSLIGSCLLVFPVPVLFVLKMIFH